MCNIMEVLCEDKSSSATADAVLVHNKPDLCAVAPMPSDLAPLLHAVNYVRVCYPPDVERLEHARYEEFTAALDAALSGAGAPRKPAAAFRLWCRLYHASLNGVFFYPPDLDDTPCCTLYGWLEEQVAFQPAADRADVQAKLAWFRIYSSHSCEPVDDRDRVAVFTAAQAVARGFVGRSPSHGADPVVAMVRRLRNIDEEWLKQCNDNSWDTFETAHEAVQGAILSARSPSPAGMIAKLQYALDLNNMDECDAPWIRSVIADLEQIRREGGAS